MVRRPRQSVVVVLVVGDDGRRGARRGMADDREAGRVASRDARRASIGRGQLGLIGSRVSELLRGAPPSPP